VPTNSADFIPLYKCDYDCYSLYSNELQLPVQTTKYVKRLAYKCCHRFCLQFDRQKIVASCSWKLNAIIASGMLWMISFVAKLYRTFNACILSNVVDLVFMLPQTEYATTVCCVQMFVRALFDYLPEEDDLIPCAQAGVLFHVGDILQVISKDDHNWWQARRWGAPPSEPAGLVPSPELQEWRTACAAIEKAKRDQAGSAVYNFDFFL